MTTKTYGLRLFGLVISTEKRFKEYGDSCRVDGARGSMKAAELLPVSNLRHELETVLELLREAHINDVFDEMGSQFEREAEVSIAEARMTLDDPRNGGKAQ